MDQNDFHILSAEQRIKIYGDLSAFFKNAVLQRNFILFKLPYVHKMSG